MDELELTPQFRVEYFLDEIVNSTDCPYEARDRIEMYLARIAGADIVTPEPQYRIEFYLAKIAGDDVEIPEPQHRAEFYLAALCGEEVELPEPHDRIDYWLYQWAEGGSLPWQTFTGNPLQFRAEKAHTLRSTVVAFSPIQSGSGDPSPDNVRPISGWNSLDIYNEPDYDPTATPKLTVTWQDEAGTVYGGTIDLTTGVLTVTHKLIEMNGTEDWVISSSWGKTNTVVFYVSGYVTDAKYDDSHCYWAINEFVAKSRLYIYGWDQECAGFTGSQGNTAPTVRIKKTTASDAVAFKAWLSEHPLQICYELITPVTYQLTPTQIDALRGINTIWSDANGDVTVEAKAEAVNLSALQSLNMLLGGRYYNNGTADEPTDEEALDILLGGNER